MVQDHPTLVAKAEIAFRALYGNGSDLKPLQSEILSALAQGESVFGALPTGYGKTLCYWLPARAWGWRVWVISPLVSLITDQALACRSVGLRAMAWTGSPTRAERLAREAEMEKGDWEICYLSPERFLHWVRHGYFQALDQMGLGPDLLVLDELHCLEEWRGFRSAYSEIVEPIRRLHRQGMPVLGLSATLARGEATAWMQELCSSFRTVISPLGRENLHLRVLPLEDGRFRWLLLVAMLRDLRSPDSAIVYCAYRDECETLARWLRSAGLAAVAYHAGIPAGQRHDLSRAFREGRLRVVCATSAFGMGIDYPNVHRVIHFSLPSDLAAYWQEAGRAGRNGAPAYAITFWRRSEIARAAAMDTEARSKFFALWRGLMRPDCRKRVIAEALGIGEADCGTCDRCQPRLGPSFPAWLRDWNQWQEKSAWWLQSAAEPRLWLAKKENGSAKDLDGL
jgi:ATP-dependent DNA helicase RecQ